MTAPTAAGSCASPRSSSNRASASPSASRTFMRRTGRARKSAWTSPPTPIWPALTPRSIPCASPSPASTRAIRTRKPSKFFSTKPPTASPNRCRTPSFANDGVLHRFGDAVGGFVEKNFEGFRVLIARVEAGDGDAQGIERGVSAGQIGVGGDVHADFLARPVRLINVREALGEADALFDDERGDAQDPAAVGAVMNGPEMRTVDGSGGFESLG